MHGIIDFRAAVQHLGLFVPWQAFLCETGGDINRIWETQKARLPKRIAWLADNIQLLRRSANDVAQDARQWAALSGESDPFADAVESGVVDRDDTQAQTVGYRADSIGIATRVIDVLRNATTGRENTAGSKEISTVVDLMHRFQTTTLGSDADLQAAVIPDHSTSIVGGLISSEGIPRQDQLQIGRAHV